MVPHLLRVALTLITPFFFYVIAVAQEATVLRDGDIFALPTFTDGIYQFIVEDLTLHSSVLLPPGTVRGDIVAMDALPDGKVAIAGINTQLFILDAGEVTRLTDLEASGAWWESIDLTPDQAHGVFDARDFGIPLERGTYLLTIEESSLANSEDFEWLNEGLFPPLSYD